MPRLPGLKGIPVSPSYWYLSSHSRRPSVAKEGARAQRYRSPTSPVRLGPSISSTEFHQLALTLRTQQCHGSSRECSLFCSTEDLGYSDSFSSGLAQEYASTINNVERDSCMLRKCSATVDGMIAAMLPLDHGPAARRCAVIRCCIQILALHPRSLPQSGLPKRAFSRVACHIQKPTPAPTNAFIVCDSLEHTTMVTPSRLLHLPPEDTRALNIPALLITLHFQIALKSLTCPAFDSTVYRFDSSPNLQTRS